MAKLERNIQLANDGGTMSRHRIDGDVIFPLFRHDFVGVIHFHLWAEELDGGLGKQFLRNERRGAVINDNGDIREFLTKENATFTKERGE